MWLRSVRDQLFCSAVISRIMAHRRCATGQVLCGILVESNIFSLSKEILDWRMGIFMNRLRRFKLRVSTPM